MQRSQVLVLAVAIVLAVAGYLAFATPPSTPADPGPNDPERTTATTPTPSQGGTTADLTTDSSNATETAQRTLVTTPSGNGAPAVTGTNVLRVILEELTEESAAMAIITAATFDKEKERTARIRQSWSSQGTTSEFDLDPYLADVAEQFPDLDFDELRVTVEHPLSLREAIRVPTAVGVKSPAGQTVYEVEVRFAEVVYWPELQLAVRDRVTRHHLDGVELRCVPTAYMGLGQQPEAGDPFTMLGDELRSPIAMRGGRKANESAFHVAGVALRPASGEPQRPADLAQPEETARGVMVYARAPGYAWGRIVLDFSKGTKRELLLEPATTMRVRFSNLRLAEYATLDKPATLCVGQVQEDGSVSAAFFQRLDANVAEKGVRIDALEPGVHTVSVELGPAFTWRKRHVLARDKVELIAGRTHEVVLALADPPQPAVPATLRGKLSFPTFGGEDDVRLWLYKSDYNYGEPDFEFALTDMEPTPGPLPTWTFRLPDLPTGRYQARLVPFQKNWMIELPPGGRDDVELVIPELAEVFVETVDVRNGERLPLETIRFFTREDLPNRIHHEHSSRRFVTRFEGEPGRFRFWAAPGPAMIRTFGIPDDLDITYRTQELELVPGLQSVRFELAPGHTIRFEFRIDGDALPHDDAIYSGLARTVRPIGHEGRVGYLTYWKLVADTPGLYEIDFDGVGNDRFRPIPSRRITVRERETTDVIVDLVRR